MSTIVPLETSGLEVASWSPGKSDEGIPPTQVHFIFNVPEVDATFVMRFKSRPALDDIVNALIEHRDFVWPVIPPEAPIITGDEDAFMAVALPVMQDMTPINVEIRIVDAWTLVSALQLATRHPDLDLYMREAIERGGRQFQDAIADRHPDAGPVLEMGWHTAFDT